MIMVYLFEEHHDIHAHDEDDDNDDDVGCQTKVGVMTPQTTK